MTLFRGSGSPGQGTDVEFLRSDRNLSDVDDADTARQNLGLASLSDIAGLDQADGNFIVGDGTNWVAESGATARSSMGVSIGSDVQAWSADLDNIGTVATLDQGTATGQVPTNSDIDDRGFAESVASVAALRAGSFPSSLDRLWLSGYYGVGTPGGGTLYRDAGDTTTADDGGTVFVDADGVRWKRAFDSAVNVSWFGATGDGTTIDTASLQGAIDTGITVYIPAGTYQIDAPITIDTRDQTIYGEGAKTVIRQATDNTDVLVISNLAVSGVQIWDMLLIGDSGASFATAGTGITSLHSGDLYFYNIITSGLFRGMFVDTRTNVSSANVYITRCNFFDAAERGLFLRNATNVFVSYTRALSCNKGIDIVDGSAYHLDHCLLNGNTTQGLLISTDLAATVDWIWLTAVEADNNGDAGLKFDSTRGLHMASCWGGSNGTNGIEFTASNDRASLANCRGLANNNHGFFLSGLIRGNLSACEASDNQASGTTDRAGFLIGTGANDLSLMGCLALDTAGRQAFGFDLAGSASNITIIGGQARGNTVAQVRDGTTGSGITIRRVRGYITKTSGTVTFPAGGPVPTVSHGLDGTPTRVLFSSRTDDEGLRYWAANFTSTTFDLLANATPAGNVDFDWIAFIGDNE